MSTAPAFAEDSGETTNAIDAIREIAPEVLESTAELRNSSEDENVAATAGLQHSTTVDLPGPGQNVISFKDGSDSMFEVEIPTSEKTTLEKFGDQPGYNNNDGSTTVPVIKSDGSVQITTVLSDASAPSKFEYKFELPVGARLVLNELDGSVTIEGADGDFLGGILPPWAKDANGTNVETSYKVSGDTLTQLVILDGSETFPVVADPWLGISLIERVVKTKDPKGFRYMVYPTPWGRAGAGAAARWAAWGEAAEKGVPRTATLQNQFLCHYDVRPVTSLKSSWNLEAYTRDKGYAGFVRNSCN
ncbi:DUF2599 domain-containing protein [Mycetocola lacteus]|nr:DUF2599 domain-containing protein [Mycetocola lacteus]